MSNDIILGAVGVLQFDVVQYRLRDEYKVESVFEPVQVHTARWIEVDDPKKLKEFRDKNDARLAHDHYGQLVRSEEHTSELQSLMRISYAVFCLKKKTKN